VAFEMWPQEALNVRGSKLIRWLPSATDEGDSRPACECLRDRGSASPSSLIRIKHQQHAIEVGCHEICLVPRQRRAHEADDRVSGLKGCVASTYWTAKRSGGLSEAAESGRDARGTMKRSGAAPDQSWRRRAASRIEQPSIRATRSRMLPPGRPPRACMQDRERHDHTLRAMLTLKLSGCAMKSPGADTAPTVPSRRCGADAHVMREHLFDRDVRLQLFEIDPGGSHHPASPVSVQTPGVPRGVVASGLPVSAHPRGASGACRMWQRRRRPPRPRPP
jgi:hypothetical protein